GSELVRAGSGVVELLNQHGILRVEGAVVKPDERPARADGQHEREPPRPRAPRTTGEQEIGVRVPNRVSHGSLHVRLLERRPDRTRGVREQQRARPAHDVGKSAMGARHHRRATVTPIRLRTPFSEVRRGPIGPSCRHAGRAPSVAACVESCSVSVAFAPRWETLRAPGGKAARAVRPWGGVGDAAPQNACPASRYALSGCASGDQATSKRTTNARPEARRGPTPKPYFRPSPVPSSSGFFP